MYLGLGYLAAGFGAGLCLIGAAFGIARLASAALEGMARQPEAAGNLQKTMIIAAAFIEGLGFFALLVCWQIAGNGGLASKPTPTQAQAQVATVAH